MVSGAGSGAAIAFLPAKASPLRAGIAAPSFSSSCRTGSGIHRSGEAMAAGSKPGRRRRV